MQAVAPCTSGAHLFTVIILALARPLSPMAHAEFGGMHIAHTHTVFADVLSEPTPKGCTESGETEQQGMCRAGMRASQARGPECKCSYAKRTRHNK